MLTPATHPPGGVGAGGGPPGVADEAAGVVELVLDTDHSDQAEAEEWNPSLSLAQFEAPVSRVPPSPVVRCRSPPLLLGGLKGASRWLAKSAGPSSLMLKLGRRGTDILSALASAADAHSCLSIESKKKKKLVKYK